MIKENYLDYEDLVKQIKKNEILPLYLFYGEENYLKKNVLIRFREKLLDSSSMDLNYRIFYGEKISIDEIINEVRTLPFMSKYKLIVLKEAEKISKKDEEKLINYFKKFTLKNNFSVLIMIYKESIPNEELIKSAKRIGLVVNFSIPNKSKLISWIKFRFKKSNKKITPEALFYLQSIIGSEVSRLFNEIEKIDIYTKDKKIIEKEDIIIAIGGSQSVNIFNVLDSIGERNIQKAIYGLVELNNSNLNYLPIFAMIHRQIKLIFQAKLLIKNGVEFNQIKNEMKLPSFVMEKTIKQSKKYTIKELCQAYKLLNLADLELKSKQKKPQIILEELVMNIVKQY
jgi:DNA polymerase-3 subunit delta